MGHLPMNRIHATPVCLQPIHSGAAQHPTRTVRRSKLPLDIRGASLTEYGIVLALLGATSIATVLGLGEEISNLFSAAADGISVASITVASSPYDPDAFVFEVSTATGAIFPSAGGNIQIDWGDETANATCTTTYVIDPNNPLTCDYPEAGTYQIAITGDMTGYGQLYSAAYKADITRMIQWGNTGLTDLSYALYGAQNLTEVPSDLPPGVEKIDGIFGFATSLNDPSVSSWNTSGIETMKAIFKGASTFNQSLDEWDMSSVVNIDDMFHGASAFNQDLSSWDTSNLESMFRSFRDTPFNGDITTWDVSNVRFMHATFRDTSAFNQDISDWDVSNVRTFYNFLYGASAFNQDLSQWETGLVKNFQGMFQDASLFQSDLSGWDVSNAVTLTRMFTRATEFQSDLSAWDTSIVKDARSLFNGASLFNSDLSEWDVSEITDMTRMFHDAPAFNGDLSGWCVSQISSEPEEFSLGSGIVTGPTWGSCP